MTPTHTSVTDAENAQYKDMFFAAVSALAEIDGLLGLPEDGCNDPQITVSALKDYMAGAQEGSNAVLSNDEIFNIAQYYIGQKDGEFDYTGFARAVIAQSRQPSSEAVGGQGEVKCAYCWGSGIDGDVGDDGRTVAVDCGHCRGTGKLLATPTPSVDAEMVKALERSMTALDDWTATCASDFCDDATVNRSLNRILEAGGTIAYIAGVQEQNRAAIAAHKGMSHG